MFRFIGNFRRRKADTAKVVDIRQIPVSVLGAVLRTLPDPRLTNHPQLKIIKVPGLGPVRVRFDWACAAHNGAAYWKFNGAETLPVDLFETNAMDEVEYKQP